MTNQKLDWRSPWKIRLESGRCSNAKVRTWPQNSLLNILKIGKTNFDTLAEWNFFGALGFYNLSSPSSVRWDDVLVVLNNAKRRLEVQAWAKELLCCCAGITMAASIPGFVLVSICVSIAMTCYGPVVKQRFLVCLLKALWSPLKKFFFFFYYFFYYSLIFWPENGGRLPRWACSPTISYCMPFDM